MPIGESHCCARSAVDVLARLISSSQIIFGPVVTLSAGTAQRATLPPARLTGVFSSGHATTGAPIVRTAFADTVV